MAGPVIVIHGGAGVISADVDDEGARAALQAALRAGRTALDGRGTALDGVLAAVESLELSAMFNAGLGGVAASDGSVSLDAAVMNGATRAAGAVAAITGHPNAAAIARAVMERTPHLLLVGAGAEAFAAAEGFARVPAERFTKSAAAGAQACLQGTVGAVALDARGGLAAATSTGGLRGKLPGRVGDSPLIGSGTYADERCALSATGDGEFFVRAVFAFRAAALVEAGVAIDAAAARALDEVVRLGGQGGCIALARDGSWAMPFVTEGMFRGVDDGSGPRVAIRRIDALS